MLARVAAAALVLGASAPPAGAQIWGGYDRPPPPRYYDAPPMRPYGPYARVVRGGACVTGRGVCPAPGLPYGYGCRCHIPGFGPKRGIVQ